MPTSDHLKMPGPSQTANKPLHTKCLVSIRPRHVQRIGLIAIVLFLLLPQAMHAQVNPCQPGNPLVTMPQIERGADGVLRGKLILADEQRKLWQQGCNSIWLRFFGSPDAKYPPGAVQPTPGEPTPGPTLRAQVGDWVELTFLNHINTGHFSKTLDTGQLTHGCDHTPGTLNWIANRAFFNGSVILPPQSANAGLYYFQAVQPGSGTAKASSPAWPQQVGGTVTDGTVTWKNIGTQHDNSATFYPLNDVMPNCIHGSSTANVHFHGTHTTPSTTGDNVLVYVLPAMGAAPPFRPDDVFVKSNFDNIFKKCQQDGPPTRWQDLLPNNSQVWQNKQKDLLLEYDQRFTNPSMKLWPKNEHAIAQGLWPQYNIGAFPYCFKLPRHEEVIKPTNQPAKMGQAPGTHWYHAHKHGSTALNVFNAMEGVFIIEDDSPGGYDRVLKDYYGAQKGSNWGLKEQVLMIQQIDQTVKMEGPGLGGAPALSVNGRPQPVITMQAGQVQQWRIVNGAARSFAEFLCFLPVGQWQTNGAPTPPNPLPLPTPCSNSNTTPQWRQIAQDGVQFDPENYDRVGAPNAYFNIATANRVDLLVKSPSQAGTYNLWVVPNVVFDPLNPGPVPNGALISSPAILLTVNVVSNTNNPSPAMPFIDKASFPKLPDFLDNIPDKEIYLRREVVFNTDPGQGRTPNTPAPGNLPVHSINGKLFSNGIVNEKMLLNAVEEWKVVNRTAAGPGTTAPTIRSGISHPLHIHINPFQVTETFEPTILEATTQGNPCYVDTTNPTTWKPCPSRQPHAPWVWWDVLAIPPGQQINLTTQCTKNGETKVEFCPPQLQPYTECVLRMQANGQKAPACTEYIAGWYKFRTRFVDFTGAYVQHCHILAHEDRGMMQLLEVVSDQSGYSHD